MSTEHPITPPSSVIDYLNRAVLGGRMDRWDSLEAAYRAGADAELEACCDWLDNTCCDNWDETAAELRASRRPKQPSLAEQALNAAKDMSDCMKDGMLPNRSSLDTIRAALERLQELENNG